MTTLHNASEHYSWSVLCHSLCSSWLCGLQKWLSGQLEIRESARCLFAGALGWTIRNHFLRLIENWWTSWVFAWYEDVRSIINIIWYTYVNDKMYTFKRVPAKTTRWICHVARQDLPQHQHLGCAAYPSDLIAGLQAYRAWQEARTLVFCSHLSRWCQ